MPKTEYNGQSLEEFMAEHLAKPMLFQEKDICGLTELILKAAYYQAKAEYFERLYDVTFNQ